MSWIVLVFGSILGSVLSAYSRRDRDNVFLRLLSSAVPLGFTVLFAYMQYKSGGLHNIAKSLQIGTSGSSVVSGIVTALIAAVICTAISKLLGIVIVQYIDDKR